MFDKQSDTAQAANRAHEHASFRARLLAREAQRPQSTLAIDSGIVYRPGSATSEHARRAAEAVRDEIRRRRAEAEAAHAVKAAPVAAVAPVPVVEAPKPAPPSDAELVSVIEEIAARKAEEAEQKARAEEILRREPEAPVPVASERRETAVAPRPSVAEAEEQVDIGTRIGDISQIAFAGLAVLGLAGLSVMAAENALQGPGRTTATDTGADTVSPTVTGAASSVALAAAAPAEPKAWFNYQGVADALAASKAEMDAAAAAAKEAAEREARLQAANAIADAEAARVAEEQKAAADAAAEARVAEEIERQRLADAEAERVAEVEAQRLAKIEADRQAAAEAEAQRVAELEAKKKAEAEAEARRLAELEVQRLAKLEAERKAAEEAARKEAFERAKAEEAEKLRLASLKAQAEADAAETLRIEQAAAKARADRIAAEKAAAVKVAVAAPAPAVAEMLPYTGPMPSAASYKPAKPKVLAAEPAPEAPVTRAAPKSLLASSASVREFDATSPQTPESFLVNRIERTAAKPLAAGDLQAVQQAFRAILDTGADGSKQVLTAPDGRAVSILLERTVSREMGQSTVRTVSYTPAVNAVTRVVTEQAPVTVRVMCRDVAYEFAGQEHGRFAACQAPDGGWTLARATDVVKVTSASLPKTSG